jgi:tetratricopeptide (TPR) repeat protein
MPYLPEIPLPHTIQEQLLLVAIFAAFIALLALLFGPGLIPRLYSRIINKMLSVDEPQKIKNYEESTHYSETNINNLPYFRNQNFVGRKLLFDRLRSALVSNKTTALIQSKAITGSGGMGKTQLALEYAYRHIDEYGVIWWIRSEETAVLAEDYASLAIRLGLLEKADKTDAQIDAARRWLEDNVGWLLIFDNARRPGDLNKYLPKIGTGHVIVTSRYQKWDSLANPLDVLEFERPESVEFLITRTGFRDEKAADALANALGDMPLALEQACAYIKETGISIKDYLERFQETRRELLNYGNPDTYSNTVASTWDLSVDAACKENPVSLDLLNLCAYLAPDQITRALLVAGSQHMPEPLASDVKNSVKLDQILASLRRYSLINFTFDGFYVHRMVQAATQDKLGEMDRKKWLKAAVRLVEDAFPNDPEHNTQSLSDCALLLPHAKVVTRNAELLGVDLNPKKHILCNVALYLRIIGEFDEAKAIFQKYLTIGEKAYGPDHPDIAIRLTNLGLILEELDDHRGARKCFERALKITEKAYGPDNPEMATKLDNLGSVLGNYNYREARKCHERALKIMEKAYGPDHPGVARCLSSRGCDLFFLGHFREVRKCHERALKIMEKAYGPDHPEVDIYYNRLGEILILFGHFREARSCFERALKIDEMTYGSGSPSSKISRSNLEMSQSPLKLFSFLLLVFFVVLINRLGWNGPEG